MPATQESRKICFQRGLAGSSVNSKGFADVTLITGGVEAEGHGLFVDEDSVAGLMDLLMGKTLPGYLTHDGAIFSDRLTKEIGLFSGFYRDGLKLKAKQFTFLNSFVKNCSDAYETLMELADKVPDQFGLSVVFGGDAVWPCEDGTEVDGEMARPENCNAAMPSIRFKSIESCDFVKAPAANPGGLFQAKVDEAEKGMAETIALSKHTEALAAKDAAFADLKAQFDKLGTDHAAALAKLGDEHKAALAAKDEELAEIVAEHDAGVAELNAQIEELKKFDAREHGGSGAIALPLGKSGAAVVTIPEPHATDPERWVQFTELNEKDPAAAAQFRAKYLGAKRIK